MNSSGDILHTHGLWRYPSWVAMEWKERFRKPHVASIHGMLQPWAWHHRAMRKRPIWKLIEYKNLQSADLLHATSEREAHAFRERGLSAPIALIPHGVDFSGPFDQSPGNLEEGSRTALFLSRLHPTKGIPLLLEAWSKIRPENWTLEIAGPDENGHLNELTRLTHELGISDCVQFSGAIFGEEKREAFQRCSLFILPTLSENFGIVIAEAMAHQRPVITTQGAPWSLLEKEECGWWVPPTVQGLADAIEESTEMSPEDLQAMGTIGERIVSERFSWSNIATEFQDCYLWLLGNGPKPGCIL